MNGRRSEQAREKGLRAERGGEPESHRVKYHAGDRNCYNRNWTSSSAAVGVEEEGLDPYQNGFEAFKAR